MAVSPTPGLPNTMLELEPQISVTGDGEPIVSGDMTPSAADGTDFGTSLFGSAARTRNYSLANSGTGLLTIESVSVSGSYDFSVSQPTSLNIAAGESATFGVTFTPTTLGKEIATISIVSDAIDQALFTFDVQADVER